MNYHVTVDAPVHHPAAVSSMPAGSRQMEVTGGRRIVWLISANTAAVSPVASASLIVVTGSSARSVVKYQASPQVQGSL